MDLGQEIIETLLSKQKEYSLLLSEALMDASSYARIHGHEPRVRHVVDAANLRDEIAKLEKKLLKKE